MLNYLIIVLLWIAIILSAVSVIAEVIFRRNSKPHRFFRAIWIRLREFSSLHFGVTSILLLFWGLVSGDDNFYGIWMAIAMMLTVLITVHTEDLLTFKKRRKKAAKKTALRPLARKRPFFTRETPLAREAAVLTPIAAENEQ